MFQITETAFCQKITVYKNGIKNFLQSSEFYSRSTKLIDYQMPYSKIINLFIAGLKTIKSTLVCSLRMNTQTAVEKLYAKRYWSWRKKATRLFPQMNRKQIKVINPKYSKHWNQKWIAAVVKY